MQQIVGGLSKLADRRHSGINHLAFLSCTEGGLFKKHLAELTERGNRWLDWKMLVASVATIGGCCLLVLAGATFYLSYLVGEMTAAESELSGIEENIKQLKAFNLDWRPCEVKGEQQICVRVMASWGGQGTHKDYFVIDPK